MKLAAIALSVGTLLTVEQRDPHRKNLDHASAAVSAGGSFVAFTTHSQLVTADTNSSSDVYVLDRARHEVTLESADTPGSSGDATRPAIDGDGRYVVFERAARVWLRDRSTGATTMIAEGQQPAISENGAVVAFSAPGLDRVADADVNNDRSDIYAVDVATGHARRISVDIPGFDASLAASVQPAINRDGRYVAFTSRIQPNGGPGGAPHVFVRDTSRNVTTLVRPGWNPSLSGDGRAVAFVALSSRLANVHLANLDTGETRLISRSVRGGAGNGASIRPAISSDGRFVAFQSDASDLIAAEDINLLWDVFVFDRTTGRIVRVSGDPAEVWMEPSGGPSIDGTGSIVAFSSRHPTDASDKKNDFDLYVATLEKRGDGPFGPPPH